MVYLGNVNIAKVQAIKKFEEALWFGMFLLKKRQKSN